MKKIIYIFILALIVSLFATSCLKEDNVKDPVVNDVKFYMADIDGKDSLITEITHGKALKIVVYSDADIITIWPSAIRTIMKKKDGVTDSVDMFGHDMLVKSDYYSDYGLVKAKGLTTSLQADGGWYASYTYPTAGSFNMTVVATNHGYDGPELHRVIYQAGAITIK